MLRDVVRIRYGFGSSFLVPVSGKKLCLAYVTGGVLLVEGTKQDD